jgi:ribose 5-phosphate isomerase
MDELKRQAAARALEQVCDGMKLGLGTGSTAKHFVELLGERVRAGLNVIGVPTSEATRVCAQRCGVALTTLDDIDRLDLTVDGADEIDPALNLVKGGGGALLREKIVAAASDRMIVIADDSKWVETLGRFPLPVEVIPFGLSAARHGAGVCAKRRFRANGGPERRGRPCFCHRWRPLDCRCPSRAHSRCSAPGGFVELDTGCCRARAVHRPCQHGGAGRLSGNSRC